MKDLPRARQLLFVVLIVAGFAWCSSDGWSRAFDRDTISHVAERVSPWVVHLSVTSPRTERDGHRAWSPWTAERVETGDGSGIIVDRDGTIVTNHHVVAGARDVAITLSDGRRVAGTVRAGDGATDVAVVTISDDQILPLPEYRVAVFGDSGDLQVGQWVVAVGSPYRLQRTVTAGIISALGRHIPTSGTRRYNRMIQTDASVNPGNSGGPLVSLDGLVIGMNAVVRTEGHGLGFAIPISLVRRIMDDLISHGRVRRSWIGVSIDPIDGAEAERLGLIHPRGAVVTHVIPEGPAERAGIRAGDVIISLDDELIEHPTHMIEQIQEATIGQSVSVGFLRDGAEKSVPLTIAEQGGRRN